jgi:hypothetical protein
MWEIKKKQKVSFNDLRLGQAFYLEPDPENIYLKVDLEEKVNNLNALRVPLDISKNAVAMSFGMQAMVYPIDKIKVNI